MSQFNFRNSLYLMIRERLIFGQQLRRVRSPDYLSQNPHKNTKPFIHGCIVEMAFKVEMSSPRERSSNCHSSRNLSSPEEELRRYSSAEKRGRKDNRTADILNDPARKKSVENLVPQGWTIESPKKGFACVTPQKRSKSEARARRRPMNVLSGEDVRRLSTLSRCTCILFVVNWLLAQYVIMRLAFPPRIRTVYVNQSYEDTGGLDEKIFDLL